MHYVYEPKEFARRIDAYFSHIQGEYHIEKIPAKTQTEPADKIIWDRLPEPALLTGLALFLGFGSRQELEDYEQRGKHKLQLRRACLRVEAEYEKRLHQQSPTGAIFALKSMGWADKGETAKQEPREILMRIEMVETGPKIAANEKDVVI